MARPRKQPDYDPAKLQEELLTEIREAYEHPLLIDADSSGRMKLNRLAEEFSITPLKARKLLITAGAYETAISQRVQELKKNGKTTEEIQQLTGLSRASVHSYLPYSKVVYNMDHLSLQAKRLHVYRDRKAAVEKLHIAISPEGQDCEAVFWSAVQCFTEYPFHKSTGERFHYCVEQDRLQLAGTDEVLTRAFLNLALSALMEDGENHHAFYQVAMKNPEKAEYLIPIFARFGLLPQDEKMTCP